MATLNVKNFPDALYEKLKKQAKKEGRSVASEVAVLVAESLARPRKYTVYDLRGVGAEIWRGMNVEEFLRKERGSW